MKVNLQNVLARTWGLMMSTSQTWEGIVSDKEEKSFKDYFTRRWKLHGYV